MQPLVSAEVDLRGMQFMPLDVNRLRDSQLAINASGDEFRAAVLLWCAAWNQIPAASLPSDDQSLAAYAGFGRDMKGWKKIKTGAMRGFVQCDDGRFYHPVVAEKALEAWAERLEYRERIDNDESRVKNFRKEHKALRDALREHGVVMSFNAKIDELRERLEQIKAEKTVTETETTETLQVVTGYLENSNASNAPVTVTSNALDMAKTGTGTGTGTGTVVKSSIEQRSARKTAERFPEFWDVYPVKKGRADAEAKWRAKGYDAIADTIIADVKRRMAHDRQWLDGYAPHGSTYVNGRGWEDAIESAKGTTAAPEPRRGGGRDFFADVL